MDRFQRSAEWFLFVVYFVIFAGIMVSTISVGLFELACAADWFG